jgi:glycerol-3-phosphate dehydrogenase (NAD(P)+)
MQHGFAGVARLRGYAMTDFRKLAIIGAGAWGTALAQTAARAGRSVTMWAREAEVVDSINIGHANPAFLPRVPLDRTIRATTDLEAALDGAGLAAMVVPAQFTREVCQRLPQIAIPLVLCAKGLEQGSGATMTDVVAETVGDAPVAVLSGPSFAAEVAQGLPAAVTLACRDEALGRALAEALGSHVFRPYWTDDVVGVQIGGAVKNVMAIAAGIVMGRRLGENARAGLITRGLAEIVRLGEALGARRETLMGLSGLGDLVLTATSPTSRNTALGIALGQGRSLQDFMAERRTVAEGVWTARAIHGLAERHGVDMPICGAVDAVLHKGADITMTITSLLERPFRAEFS